MESKRVGKKANETLTPEVASALLIFPLRGSPLALKGKQRAGYKGKENVGVTASH